jgi:hypothetical protein
MTRASLSLAAIALLVSSSAAIAGNPLIPTPIGAGPRFHPRALSSAVAQRKPIGGLRCEAAVAPRFGVHLELFARGRVVLVPAGIGVATPWRTLRPNLVAGPCSYPTRTSTPTGVIEIPRGRRLTLGRFFAVWHQPLDARHLAGFTAGPGQRVRAYVGGARWRGPIGAIPLSHHAEIVLELGRYIPPHSTFLFGRGL